MIAIVDYKAGNLTSVQLALKEVGFNGTITSDRQEILNADRVIFPGVGAAGAAMEHIHQLDLSNILKDFVATGKPLLGICVGAQIILERSEENNNTPCIGLIPGEAKHFKTSETHPIKIPQIGWNQVAFKQKHPIFNNIDSEADFYFVHSYYPVPSDSKYSFAETTYGNTTFSSVIGRDNLIACQFHLEKSGTYGLQLLKNFCLWNGQFSAVDSEVC